MFIDAQIERSPFTVNTSVPDIAPVAPASFKPEILADGLHVYIEGQADAGGLVEFVRPFLQAEFTGQFTRTVTITPDEAVPEFCGAIEFDLRPTLANGYTLPYDVQWNAQTGHLEIAIGVAVGKIQWMDTGIALKLPPGVASTITLWLSANLAVMPPTCSVLSAASSSGGSGTVPKALQNQPAFSLGWAPGKTVYQHQADVANGVGPGGGAFSWAIANDDLQYTGS